MTLSKTLASAAIAAAMTLGIAGNVAAEAPAPKNANEALVLKAMTELFVKRNTAILPQLWSPSYKQHNPTIANGRTELKPMIEALPANFSYTPGFITSNGDIVMIHGRYVGFAPTVKIAVDIFRVQNGKLVEHWDVLQDETPADQTKTGNAMFEPTGR